MQGSFPRLVTSVPGPCSLALWDRERAIIAPGLQSVTQWARVSFSHGEGAILYDVDGNALIDSGLKAGEQVVVDGQYRLQPGTHVAILKGEAADEAAVQQAQQATIP